MYMNNKDWKEFERLVAALHYAEAAGGKVTWNDKISSREFDITIRFIYGFYQYLTVIECKNYKSRVPVSEVEAFITKARDVNANKAVMVSSHGYQEGSKSVAERHGIELLILSEEYVETDTRITTTLIPVLIINNIRLERSDNHEEFRFPNEMGGKLLYLVEKTKITVSGKTLFLKELFRNWQLSKPIGISDKPNNFRMDLPSGAIASIPPEHEIIPVKTLMFSCQVDNAQRITRPALDPYLESQDLKHYILKTKNGDIIRSVKANKIDLGFDTELKEGCFYIVPELRFYYYCEKIMGDEIHWILIESYQHGDFIQAKFTQLKEDAKNYIKITDKKNLNRLEKLLCKFNEI